VAAPAPVGGAERVVEALAIGHRRRGHDVSVATVLFNESKHPLVAALADADVPVHEIRLSPRDYLGERRAIRDLCRTLQPQIVHTHGYRTDVVDRGVAAQLRIPTVTTVHGPSMNGGLKGAFYEWVQRTNYRRFEAVVAVSAALRATTLADGVASERLHLIPNAFGAMRASLARPEARRRLGIDTNATVIGWVGRLIPIKGADIFLEALQRLPSPRPTVVMIGHGAEAEALAQQAQQLGLQDVVRFYHDVTDADRLFSAFDAFVLSSRSEGTPLVLLEAMAARVPIIATSVGGVPEMTGSGEALLVPAEDPVALAHAITDVLQNPDTARQRTEQAAARLKTAFSFDEMLDRYEEVYRAIQATD
jgi:glycosyltransferase involved in cell wall biosynthesis